MNVSQSLKNMFRPCEYVRKKSYFKCFPLRIFKCIALLSEQSL